MTTDVGPGPEPDQWTGLRRLTERAREDGEPSGAWYQSDALTAFIDDDGDQVIPDIDARFIAAASPDVVLALLEARAEAVRSVLAAVREGVEALNTHEGHAYEPGIEWLCVPTGLNHPPYSQDCGNADAHYRLIDRAAVRALLDTFTETETPRDGDVMIDSGRYDY